MNLDADLVARMTARLMPLRVEVDGNGQVGRIEGDPAWYGYPQLRRGQRIEDEIPLLLGMVDLAEFELEAVEMPSGKVADVGWSSADGRGVLTLFDVTQNRSAVQATQQTANDALILQYRLKQASEQLRKKQQELIYIAYHDALTGLFNRRQFFERLPEEIGRSRRGGTALSLAMIDIDHFKLYNDRYGHLGGDRCLHEVATRVGAMTRRPGDLAARIGGEEFAVLLPDTDAEHALDLARHLCEAVRGARLEHLGSPREIVTVSVGVAQLRGAAEDPSWELLYREADSALYDAKHQGRDRAVMAPAPRG